MAYHVYVLLNPDGKTCVGETSDLERRLAQHNEPDFRATLHTKRYRGPWGVVPSEAYPTREGSGVGRSVSHPSIDLVLAILNEEIEHEAWFAEFLGQGPSGHFRRREVGESPFVSKYLHP